MDNIVIAYAMLLSISMRRASKTYRVPTYHFTSRGRRVW